MICPNCAKEIEYSQLLDAKNSRICPLCLGVVFKCNHAVKEKLMAERGIKMPFETAMDSMTPGHGGVDRKAYDGKQDRPVNLCVKGCGTRVRRPGIMCGSCRGRVALEVKRLKRKEIIMSGKPENILKLVEPVPIPEPVVLPASSPDPISEITSWRRKAQLWDIFSDRLNAIFTDLAMLRDEIGRSA